MVKSSFLMPCGYNFASKVGNHKIILLPFAISSTIRSSLFNVYLLRIESFQINVGTDNVKDIENVNASAMSFSNEQTKKYCFLNFV